MRQSLGRGRHKKYKVTADRLRDLISRQYRAGDEFPAERKIAADFKVSPATIRKALDMLKDDGLLIRSQGKRTIVGGGGLGGGRRMRTVLLLTFDGGAFVQEEILAVQRELFNAGFVTSLFSMPCLLEPMTPDYLREIIGAHRNVSGIIAGPIFGQYERVSGALEESGMPVVLIGSTKPIAANYVAVDAGTGMYEALRHLDQIGCRRIRCFSKPGYGNLWERDGGVRRFLSEFRPQESLESFMVPAIGTMGSGYSAACAEFEAGRIPDGIMAHNDLCAIGIMLAARKCGVNIPEDVALCGYDGIAQAAELTPALTTVEQPKANVAQEAVRILKMAIESPGIARAHEVLLQPRLVFRESTTNYRQKSEVVQHLAKAPAGVGDRR